jgi:hypothetical protein
VPFPSPIISSISALGNDSAEAAAGTKCLDTGILLSEENIFYSLGSNYGITINHLLIRAKKSF